MMQRCDKASDNYKFYGEKGISFANIGMILKTLFQMFKKYLIGDIN